MAVLTQALLAFAALAAVGDSVTLATRRLAQKLSLQGVNVTSTINASHASAASEALTNASSADGRQGRSACPDCPCSAPEDSPPKKWEVLKDVVEAFNALNAPYNIEGGTLLGLRRGCNIFDSDIDFAVDGDWLTENSAEFSAALEARGFSIFVTFGSLSERGYEEAWHSSALQLQGRRTNAVLRRGQVKVDIFTVQRFSDHYVWHLWVTERPHPCSVNSTGTAVYNWLGLDVKVPVPVDAALISAFGPNFLIPQGWVWDQDPFYVGSCERSPP
eukprot:TRINITY_DN124555_c0_g1_i1.p1 TRINITY_DN124555_c0_g1~~TRINITY_DN124555_c0_g1_i1.p1  ORF type:complete len:274 (+),score=36.50 TRINITY_DN124555_c0_g1_i1:67-888(+)